MKVIKIKDKATFKRLKSQFKVSDSDYSEMMSSLKKIDKEMTSFGVAIPWEDKELNKEFTAFKNSFEKFKRFYLNNYKNK